jgi:adenine-specific DNA-methyltransferase
MGTNAQFVGAVAPRRMVEPLSRLRERGRGEGLRLGIPYRLRLHAALRSVSTDAEQRLWFHLRAHRFGGLKFKREVPIGPYIVDFLCLERSLVIELDGGQHSEQERADDDRDGFLRSRGLRVLRFWNDEFLRDTETCLQVIWGAAFGSETLSPSPSPASGRGEHSSDAT